MTQVTFEQAIEIALKQFNAGQLQEAESICRQILARDPNRGDALHLLGLIAHKARHPDAVALIRRSIALQPQNAVAYTNLALVLQAEGRVDEAIECSRQALALQPNVAEAHFNLGYAFHCKGELDNAIACYQRALALKPALFHVHLNLGAALQAQGQSEQAIEIYRRGLAEQPASASLLSNLSNAMWEADKLEEATDCGRRAVTIDPNFVQGHLNLGNALISNLKFEEGIESYRRAIALDPNAADAHNNLAMALLTLGQFDEGWREHEWRWRHSKFRSVRRNFTQPQWDGSDLTDRTILLHTEQGLGDALQFVRFAPFVKSRGGRVVLECQPSLLRLFQNAPELGIDSIVVQNPSGAAPPILFDVHIPLLSLPLALQKLDPEQSPSQAPYLRADALSQAHWREVLAAEPKRLKVGLVWSGNALHAKDKSRPVSLKELAPLAREDVQFYSLQVGVAAAEIRDKPSDMRLLDHTDQISDLADTAGLVSQLDLVISVDTSVAHLAGAMGKAVWVFIPFRPDYRWRLDREDTPWYPTMRLFRQKRPGDWQEPIERIAEALDEALRSTNGPIETPISSGTIGHGSGAFPV
jgi:tetratricopeptide (TPR) repeat protein